MNAGNFALSDDGRYMSVVTRNEIHIITVSVSFLKFKYIGICFLGFKSSNRSRMIMYFRFQSMEYIAYSVAPRYVISTQFLSSSSNIVYAMTGIVEIISYIQILALAIKKLMYLLSFSCREWWSSFLGYPEGRKAEIIYGWRCDPQHNNENKQK